ncbi:hypothetical protein Aglo03_13740 [Actinokineospora globicatena]|uniref:Uncharacterized protein n=1 Tax=Actinokineospora globicatena TaxID=103729 RepID=A0A9W6V933_9PSEU|nr:hypothetical protein Aglo03_13740 [Actinokineospora globicatena]
MQVGKTEREKISRSGSNKAANALFGGLRGPLDRGPEESNRAGQAPIGGGRGQGAGVNLPHWWVAGGGVAQPWGGGAR